MFRKIKVIALLAIMAVTFYFIARVVLLGQAEYGYLDGFFGILLLVGEAFFIFHALGYSMNILRANKYSPGEVKEIDLSSAPEVAVVIATRNEPKEIVEDTVLTVRNLEYPNKNIYILDDSTGEKFIEGIDELGEDLDVEIVRREDSVGAKAGAINNFLKSMTEKYIAIFDADQNPMPGFLKRTVQTLEEDEEMAFIQTPQLYTNVEVSPIAKVSQAHQSIFYEYIMEGKSQSNSVFACGTNLVMRRGALLEVGGFDESSVTEDFATSLKLHMEGFKSKFDSKPSVFGMAPESLPEFIKQQTRWATGTVGLLRKMFKNLLTSFKSLSLTQWWEYFLSGSYYFIGWAFLFLMICPIMFLLFGIPSYFASPEVYLLFYAPYFLLTLGIFYTTMKERGFSASKIYHGSIVSFLIFPTLMLASINGLIGKDISFGVTGKGKVEKLPLKSLWPQIFMIMLSVAALISGAYTILGGANPAPIVVNMAWVGYHIFVLSNVFHYNKLPGEEI